jgi:hypothetical protein
MPLPKASAQLLSQSRTERHHSRPAHVRADLRERIDEASRRGRCTRPYQRRSYVCRRRLPDAALLIKKGVEQLSVVLIFALHLRLAPQFESSAKSSRQRRRFSRSNALVSRELRAVLPSCPPATFEAFRGPRPSAHSAVHPTAPVLHRGALAGLSPPCPCAAACALILAMSMSACV